MTTKEEKLIARQKASKVCSTLCTLGRNHLADEKEQLAERPENSTQDRFTDPKTQIQTGRGSVR
jgi:hypothetical protein